jgi:flagellar basal-body rod protein FlgG
MNNSMINAFVSMHSLQQKLDLLAGNIANVNTTGYKKKEASFEDVLTNTKPQPESFRKDGRLTPLGYNIGWGSKLVGIQSNFAQGQITPTQNPTDLAIQGDGLFEVEVQTQDANGNPVTEVAWTRNGAFNLVPSTDPAKVFLATKEGHLVRGVDDQPIVLPANTHPQIDASGNVLAIQDGRTQGVKVGQIKLVRVARPQLLKEMGDGLYTLPTTGNAQQDQQLRASILQNANNLPPTDSDRVEVKQGYLEQSNVNLSDEMSEVIAVQRAFQLNARALTSADTMMNLANNLRG